MADLKFYALSVLCKDHDAEAYERAKGLYFAAMRYKNVANFTETSWGAERAHRQASEYFYELERIFWKAGLNKLCTWHEMCRFWHDNQ